MNQVSRPDPSRLVYRIRTALTGESAGLETAKLAYQFAEATEQANVALAEAEHLLADDRLLEALELESRHPDLINSAKTLAFDQWELWRERCELYGWRSPSKIDLQKANDLEARFNDVENLKEWLYAEYRTAIRSKKRQDDAFRLISQIAGRFPEDGNAVEELERCTSQLMASAERELEAATTELIPAQSPQVLIERYARLGLPLERSAHPAVLQTLQAEKNRVAEEASARAQSVVDRANDLPAGAAVELEYLACDYMLAITGTRGTIDAAARAGFEELGTRLSRLRNAREAIISIRQAIGELKDRHARKHVSGPLSKRSQFAKQHEKVRSLEKQALRISGQLPPEIQAELKSAYAFARRRRIPRFALLGAAAAALLISSIWLTNLYLSREASKERAASALSALQQAEDKGSVADATEALKSWETIILENAVDSAVVDQAEILQEWVALQNDLETEYNQLAEQLEQLTSYPDPTQNETAILQLATKAERVRRDLAADRGTATEQRIQSLINEWSTSLSAAKQERDQQLLTLQRELALAVGNAAKAKSRAEFERLSAAAATRSRALDTLADQISDTSARDQLREQTDKAQQTLQPMEAKWSALESELQALPATSQLDEYLERLERIHSFDILPADKKTAIEQSLRLKSAFGAIERRILLPQDSDAWTVFSEQGNYARDRVELSEDEAAYIEGLSHDEVFKNVFQSTVQYFEGNAQPQSEYSIYLVEPLSKSDSENEANSISFSFRVRGYNEMGYPEPEPRQIQFISRNDGSFWGFFYKPSVLSAESRYYQDTISLTIRHLLAGAHRLAVIEQIDDLEKQENLSPAFRAYWQQRFLELMSIDPWKWGLALSPALQKKATRLRDVSGGEISERLWLSIIEQTVPSPELDSLLDKDVGTLALAEVEGFARLYQNALSGEFELAGYIAEDGQPSLAQGVDQEDALWTVNTLTGRIEKLSSDIATAAFAPLLRYRYHGGGEEELLDGTRQQTDIAFTEERYELLLPPLLK